MNAMRRAITEVAILLWVASIPLSVFLWTRVPIAGATVPPQIWLLPVLAFLAVANKGGKSREIRCFSLALTVLLVTLVPATVAAGGLKDWTTLGKMALNGLALLALMSLVDSETRWRRVVVVYAAAALVTVALAAVHWLLESDLLRLQAWRPHSSNQLSFVLLPGLIAAVALGLTAPRRQFLIWLVVSQALWVGILQTYSRGGWIASLTGLVVLAVLGRSASHWRRGLAFVGLGSLAAILIVPRSFVAPAELEEVKQRFREARKQAAESAAAEPPVTGGKPELWPWEDRTQVLERRARSSLEARKQLLTASWEAIRQRPLRGWGFRHLLDIDLYRKPTTPHNSYLALMIYYGLPAFAAGMAFLILLGRSLLRVARSAGDPMSVVPVAVFCAAIIHFAVADFFFGAWGWGVMAFAAARAGQAKNGFGGAES